MRPITAGSTSYWNSQRVSGNPATRGTYGYYEYNEVGTAGSTGAGMHNLFIQDQWRVAKRLTLTLGLRTENEWVPSVNRALKDYAFHFGFADKIAPRLGASYDVFGDGRLKLYGSWGRYFDWVKYELSRGSYGGDYWRIYYRTLDSPNVFTDLATRETAKPARNQRLEQPDFPQPPLQLHRVRRHRCQADEPGQHELRCGVPDCSPDACSAATTCITTCGAPSKTLGLSTRTATRSISTATPAMGHALIMPTSGATKPFPMPKAVRKYDAMELSVNRRFSKGMFGSFSYVYSRLYGNYAGLASSDEITSPASGSSSRTAQQLGGSIARSGGNVNRAWDLDEVLFDAHGTLDIKGRLATDRPHVFKLYGNKEFNWKSDGSHGYRHLPVRRQRHPAHDGGTDGQPDPDHGGRPRQHGPYAVPDPDRLHDRPHDQNRRDQANPVRV